VFRRRRTAQPPAKETPGLIEKENRYLKFFITETRTLTPETFIF
jgi:hypothetical protein